MEVGQMGIWEFMSKVDAAGQLSKHAREIVNCLSSLGVTVQLSSRARACLDAHTSQEITETERHEVIGLGFGLAGIQAGVRLARAKVAAMAEMENARINFPPRHGSAVLRQTNREAHEEAAGMGLCPEFFRHNGIEAEQPATQPIQLDSSPSVVIHYDNGGLRLSGGELVHFCGTVAPPTTRLASRLEDVTCSACLLAKLKEIDRVERRIAAEPAD